MVVECGCGNGLPRFTSRDVMWKIFEKIKLMEKAKKLFI